MNTIDHHDLILKENIRDCIKKINHVIEFATDSYSDERTITYKYKKSTVTFTAGLVSSSYKFETYKSIFGFKFAKQEFTIASDNPHIDFVDWHRIGRTMNRINYKFGIN